MLRVSVALSALIHGARLGLSARPSPPAPMALSSASLGLSIRCTGPTLSPTRIFDWGLARESSIAPSLLSSLVTSGNYPMITQESFASSTPSNWGRPHHRQRGRWKDAGSPGPLKVQSCTGDRFATLQSLCSNHS